MMFRKRRESVEADFYPDGSLLRCPLWFTIDESRRHVFLSKFIYSFASNSRVFVSWLNSGDMEEEQFSFVKALDLDFIKNKVPGSKGMIYDVMFECKDYKDLALFVRDFWHRGYTHIFVLDRNVDVNKLLDLSTIREKSENETLDTYLPEGLTSLLITMPDWVNLMIVTRISNSRKIVQTLKELCDLFLIEFKNLNPADL